MSHDSDQRPTIDGADYPSRETREAALGDLPNVVGHGIGHAEAELDAGGRERTGEVCVCVHVREKVPPEDLAPGERIPPDIDGVPTDVIEVGELDFQMDEQRRAAIRPIASGTNIAGEGSGTVGATLWDTAANQPIVTSAVHVMGDVTRDNSDLVGTDAYQPNYDHSDYHIGEVVKGSNTHSEPERTDICFVDPSESVDSDGPPQLSTYQYGLGETIAVEEPELDVRVMRSSLNSGISCGRVVGVDVTATLSDVTFHGLFESDLFSQPGDSGSAVGYVTSEGDFVAMGSLIGGPRGSPGAFMAPFSRTVQDSGLDAVEPLTGHADHTGHDRVSTSPPPIPSSPSSFLEAHPRRVYRNGTQFDISVLVASTSGGTATSTLTLDTQDGTTLITESVTLASGEYDTLTLSISENYQGERLRLYTEDQAAVIDDRDQTLNRLGFTVADDPTQTGYTENGPAPPIDITAPIIEADSVALEWTPSPNAGTPTLFEHHVYVNGEFDHVVGPEETSTVVEGLAAGTDYTLGVTAVDRGGLESPPVEATVTTAEGLSVTYVRASGTLAGPDDSDSSTQSRSAGRFNGQIVAGTVDGEAQIELDGEVFDVGSVPDRPDGHGGNQTGDPEEIDRRDGSLWIRHDLRRAKQN